MRYSRILILGFLLMLILAGSANASGWDSSFLRSLLIPGAGQAHKGHYTKAAFFATSSVISGVGVFISQVHYNRSVEKYNSEKAAYLALKEQYDGGEIINYGDVEDTYYSMEKAFHQAKRRYRWRNVFLGSLIGSYTLNLIDAIISKPAEKKSLGISLEFKDDGLRLQKSFSF